MTRDAIEVLSTRQQQHDTGNKPQQRSSKKHLRKLLDGKDGKPPAKKRRKEPDLAEQLNALTSADFESFIPQAMLQVPAVTSTDPSFSISHKRADAMKRSDFDNCFGLIEETSLQDYRNSSIGWNPRHKRTEMSDEDMHYLLVTASANGSDSSPQSSRNGSPQTFAGFMSFMVTTDSDPVVPLIYIYEIHLAPSHRGRGLGKHLMELVTQIAFQAGLQMLMLTCFTCNENARRFYKRYGFTIDPTSPGDRRTRGKVIKSDHIYMSKRLSLEEG